MSGTLTLEGSPQAGTVQPKIAAAPTVEIVDQNPGSGPTAEEALEASRKAIQNAEASARAAQQRESAAQQELQRLRQSQQQDQAAVLAAAVESSTSRRDQLAEQWQAALEAGDYAAAKKINTDLAMASAQLDRAAGELAMLKEGASRRQQPSSAQGGQQPNAVSEASQRWISSKPEFNRHRDALILRHQELLNDGIQPDSRAYFRELDSEYDRLTGGANHRDNNNNGDRSVAGSSNGQRQFDGAPPSRGGNGGGSQGGTVNTLLGPVTVRTVNGQTFLTIPDHLRADFAEGAKVVGMSLPEYTMEQVNIARERQSGGTGGLIMEEGRTYR